MNVQAMDHLRPHINLCMCLQDVMYIRMDHLNNTYSNHQLLLYKYVK